MKSTAAQYGTVAVTLHWIAALLIANMIVSGLILEDLDDGLNALWVLRWHAASGIVLLGLTLIRIVWWLVFDKRPDPVAGTGKGAHRLARVVHNLFYILILAMSFSGIGMLALSGADAIVLGNVDQTLPDFSKYAPRAPHGLAANIIIMLVIAHIGAAIYHQIVKRDGALQRMWYRA